MGGTAVEWESLDSLRGCAGASGMAIDPGTCIVGPAHQNGSGPLVATSPARAVNQRNHAYHAARDKPPRYQRPTERRA